MSDIPTPAPGQHDEFSGANHHREWDDVMRSGGMDQHRERILEDAAAAAQRAGHPVDKTRAVAAQRIAQGLDEAGEGLHRLAAKIRTAFPHADPALASQVKARLQCDCSAPTDGAALVE